MFLSTCGIFLTARLQTELAVTTNVVVSDVYHGVVDTRAMVSDIRRKMIKGPEGADNQYQLVSDVCVPFHR